MRGNAREQARITLWTWLAGLGAAFAFAPLTESRAYLVVGVLSAGLVCLTGFALRTLRVPWLLTAAAQLIVLVWWATLVYASDTTVFAIFPSFETFSTFQVLLTDALHHAKTFAAPVPEEPALHALLSVGTGLLALIVDIVAGSLRQAPVVGLIFLAVYMAPVALLSGQVPLWFFLPGALGFIFLLAAQERIAIARWGRNVAYADAPDQSDARGVYSAGMAAASRRVGFGAVALAVVLPLMIPTLSTNLFGEGGIRGGVGGEPNGDVQVSNPVIDMRRNLRGQSDTELLRIDGVMAEPEYVRIAALDTLDDDGWLPSKRGPKTEDLAGMPAAPTTGTDLAYQSATFDVRISDAFDSRWLPTIYWPTSIDADGEWRIDADHLDVVAGDEQTTAAGKRYQMNVALPAPEHRQLVRSRIGDLPSSLRSLITLPDNTPDAIRERAEELTAGESSPFEQAQAIQEWFRNSGGFEYTTEAVAGNGMDTIEDFVTDDRRGYCEQFASAMAMMARSLGIPARVSVGFLSGDQLGSTYVFRGTDMHAWPELYLGDAGWVRFEPTPGSRTGAPPDFGQSNPEPGESAITPGQRTQNTPERSPNESNNANPGAQNDDDDSAGAGGFPWRGIGVTVVVLGILALLAMLPRQLRVRRRERRWRTAPEQAAEAAWAELRDTLRDLRMPWPEGTPRAVGRRLRPMLESRPHAVDSLNTVVLAVERARYAERAEAVDLRTETETISRALASRVTKKQRRRAEWMPLSLLSTPILPRLGRRRRQHGERLIGQSELIALEEQ